MSDLTPLTPNSPTQAQAATDKAKQEYVQALSDKPNSPFAIMLGKIFDARLEYERGLR